MITFILSLIVLIAGYIIYGAFVEKVFGIDPNAKTPATTKTDGVDFVPMKPWRIFLVQFLNIAGLGPIFGAIMGIFFGPAAFLWIVFGTIFAGGVHDYLSGMLSIRKGDHLNQKSVEFITNLHSFLAYVKHLLSIMFWSPLFRVPAETQQTCKRWLTCRYCQGIRRVKKAGNCTFFCTSKKKAVPLRQL